MTGLRIALLAFTVFTAWEWLSVALPYSLPAWLQPIAVVGLGYGVPWVPERWVTAMALAGAVALLHTLVRGATAERPELRLPRRHPATGRRVPDLP